MEYDNLVYVSFIEDPYGSGPVVSYGWADKDDLDQFRINILRETPHGGAVGVTLDKEKVFKQKVRKQGPLGKAMYGNYLDKVDNIIGYYRWDQDYGLIVTKCEKDDSDEEYNPFFYDTEMTGLHSDIKETATKMFDTQGQLTELELTNVFSKENSGRKNLMSESFRQGYQSKEQVTAEVVNHLAISTEESYSFLSDAQVIAEENLKDLPTIDPAEYIKYESEFIDGSEVTNTKNNVNVEIPPVTVLGNYYSKEDEPKINLIAFMNIAIKDSERDLTVNELVSKYLNKHS